MMLLGKGKYCKHYLFSPGLFMACLGLVISNLTIHADSALRAGVNRVSQDSPTGTSVAPCTSGSVSLTLDTSHIQAEVEKNYPYYLTFGADPGITDVNGQRDCIGRRLYSVDLGSPGQSTMTTDNGSLSWAEGSGQLSPDGRYEAFVSERQDLPQNQVTDQ